MAKRLEDRLSSNKLYRSTVGRMLTNTEIKELHQFHEKVGYNPDRIKTIIQFILLEYNDWAVVWDRLKSVGYGTLAYYQILYGTVEGKTRYKELCKKKTRGFDHSPEIQRGKALKSAKLSRGNKQWSVRGVGYWIKQGFTGEEALIKVKNIQATNSLERYIKKYGKEEGTSKFNQRKEEWTSTMKDPEIGRKRSLGLWRYIERYGEIEGEKIYTEMRLKRNRSCRIGRASAESISAFEGVIKILEDNEINYYLGVEGNKEWFIHNKEIKQMFFYDLTIPTLGIVIEYHGEGFHPNPGWSDAKLNEWKQLRTGRTALEVLAYTEKKNETARNNGWTVFEIFSSEVSNTVPRIKKVILELIRS